MNGTEFVAIHNERDTYRRQAAALRQKLAILESNNADLQSENADLKRELAQGNHVQAETTSVSPLLFAILLKNLTGQ